MKIDDKKHKTVRVTPSPSVLRWKALHRGMKSAHGDKTENWKSGKHHSVVVDDNKHVTACYHGYHCSRHLADAMHHVHPHCIALVECSGESSLHPRGDKEAWQTMRVVAWTSITKEDFYLALRISLEVIGFNKRSHARLIKTLHTNKLVRHGKTVIFRVDFPDRHYTAQRALRRLFIFSLICIRHRDEALNKFLKAKGFQHGCKL